MTTVVGISIEKECSVTNTPSVEEILNAVKASGYLMEQEVGNLLEQLGFDVQTNYPYKDIEEGKSRELDVQAIRHIYSNNELKFSVYIELLVECKNNTSPLVFLSRAKTEVDTSSSPKEIIFPYETFRIDPRIEGVSTHYRGIEPFNYFQLSSFHYQYNSSLKATQFCKVVRKGPGWEANHEGIYDSIFYPLVKAFLARKKTIDQRNWKHVWMFFPIVVVNSKMFNIDVTSTEPTPSEIEHITFVRELDSVNIKGKFSIDFVTLEGLREFVTNKIENLGQRVKHLATIDAKAFTTQDVLNETFPQS